MINIYLVRHGETQTNLKKLVCGQMDTEMTPLGYKQVEKTAKQLIDKEFDHYFTSPLLRATETAKKIAPLNNFIQVDDLMEMNTGEHSTLHVNQLWENYPKFKYQGRYPHNQYPNGESLSMLYTRISTWLTIQINSSWTKDSNILIVGHEATVVCAIHHFLQIPLDSYPSFKISNAGIVKLMFDRDNNQTRVEFMS